MFIVISFPTKTIKDAENLGVNFWIVVKKNFQAKKNPLRLTNDCISGLDDFYSIFGHVLFHDDN